MAKIENIEETYEKMHPQNNENQHSISFTAKCKNAPDYI